MYGYNSDPYKYDNPNRMYGYNSDPYQQPASKGDNCCNCAMRLIVGFFGFVVFALGIVIVVLAALVQSHKIGQDYFPHCSHCLRIFIPIYVFGGILILTGLWGLVAAIVDRRALAIPFGILMILCALAFLALMIVVIVFDKEPNRFDLDAAWRDTVQTEPEAACRIEQKLQCSGYETCCGSSSDSIVERDILTIGSSRSISRTRIGTTVGTNDVDKLLAAAMFGAGSKAAAEAQQRLAEVEGESPFIVRDAADEDEETRHNATITAKTNTTKQAAIKGATNAAAQCNSNSADCPSNCSSGNQYTDNCKDKMMHEIRHYLWAIIGISAAIFVLGVAVGIMAFCI